MSTLQVHTTYDAIHDRWHNKIAGSSATFGAADQKSDAIAAGRAEAASLGAEHVVHNQDGTVASRTPPGGHPATHGA